MNGPSYLYGLHLHGVIPYISLGADNETITTLQRDAIQPKCHPYLGHQETVPPRAALAKNIHFDMYE